MDITLRYSSSDAVVTESEYNRNESIENMNYFCVGWNLNLPQVLKSNKSSSGYNRNDSIRLANGSTYEISGTTLKGYKLSDLSLSTAQSYDDINRMVYILTYKDGRKEIFDYEYGDILRIVDRFGNRIKFEYDELDYFQATFEDYLMPLSFYNKKVRLLSKITDSMEREIIFSMNTEKLALGSRFKNLTISNGNTEVADLEFESTKSYNGKVSTLKSITTSGMKTSFFYSERIAQRTYDVYDVNGSWKYQSLTPNGSCFTLDKVTYPTGGSTYYEYAKKARATGNSYGGNIKNYYNIFKLQKRYDRLSEDTENLNELSYSYEGDYSGYPNYWFNSDTEEISDSSAFYHTVVSENTGGDRQKTTVYSFDYMHRKIKEETFDAKSTAPSVLKSIGDTVHNVFYGNYIYRLVSNGEYLAVYRSTNAENMEETFLSSYPLSYFQVVRSVQDRILIFCSGIGTVNVLEYSILDNQWKDGGSYTYKTGYNTGQSYIQNIFYLTNKFYIPCLNGKLSVFCIYDPAVTDISQRWSTINYGQQSAFKCTIGNKIYYINGGDSRLYSYDILTKVLIAMAWVDSSAYSSLPANQRVYLNGKTVYGAFELDGVEYLLTPDAIASFPTYNRDAPPVRIEYESDIFPFPGNIRTAMSSADTMYVVNYENSSSENGKKRGLYRFKPSTGECTFLMDKIFYDNSATLYFTPSGNIYSTIGTKSENFEVMIPNKPTVPRVKAEYTYNDDKQLLTQKSTVYGSLNTTKTLSQNWAYDGKKNNVTSYTDEIGRKKTYAYDSTYYLPTEEKSFAMISTEGSEPVETLYQTVTYTLSADKDRVEQQTVKYSDTRSIESAYTYEEGYRGNVASETVTDCTGSGESAVRKTISEKAYAYDANHGLITKALVKNIATSSPETFAVDPAVTFNLATTYTYDAFGRKTSETITKDGEADGLSDTTSYAYNDMGWLTHQTNPDGTYLDTTYDLTNGFVRTTLNNGYSSIDMVDGLGRVVLQKDQMEETQSILKEIQYDAVGNVAQIKDGNGNPVSYTYDIFGRVRIMQYGSGDACEYTYVSYDDVTSKKTVQLGNHTEKTYYDDAGRVIKTDAGQGLITTTKYDHRDLMTSQTDGKGNTTSSQYNELGQPTVVTNALGEQVTYEYDERGNVVKTTMPGGSVQTAVYDTIGRVVQSTDAIGQNSFNAYDILGNVIKNKDRNGNITNFSYDSVTKYLSGMSTDGLSYYYFYDNMGNLNAIDSGERTLNSNTYRKDGLLASATSVDGKTIQYSYDAAGNVTSVTDYDGQTFQYGYDYKNRLTSIHLGTTQLATYQYENGLLKKITYPGQGSSEYLYDSATQIIQAVNKQAADDTVINQYQYTYDSAGNQLTKQDGAQTTSYSYDALNRLRAVNEPDGTKTAYSFDPNGNRTAKRVTHPSSYSYEYKQDGVPYAMSNIAEDLTTYAYDANNRLLQENSYVGGSGTDYSGMIESVTSYQYDNNRNLLKEIKGGQIDQEVVECEYDVLNQLTWYKGKDGAVTTYGYDGTGMRTAKTMNGETTRFYWDRGFISNESVGGTTTATNYIGAGGIFARQQGGTTDYLLKNGHGDVTAKVSGGAVTKTYDYDAFGVEKNPDPSDTNPFRYCGEYFDNESGSIFLRAPYYMPNNGRFTQEDPIKYKRYWYVYCSNNPVVLIDALGLAPTIMEAAEMADHIYKDIPLSDNSSEAAKAANRAARTVAGWRLIDVYSEGSFKMGVYIRDGDDWQNPSEYVIVNKGTSVANDWDDNLLQPLGGSGDMRLSIDHAKWFSDSHSQEITFVRHSKGGGEAMANAVATNRKCITFNPAKADLDAYGLKDAKNSYTKTMTHYVVEGEILNNKFGNASIGYTEKLRTQVKIDSWTLDAWGQRTDNRHMWAVKAALKQKGY